MRTKRPVCNDWRDSHRQRWIQCPFCYCKIHGMVNMTKHLEKVHGIITPRY